MLLTSLVDSEKFANAYMAYIKFDWDAWYIQMWAKDKLKSERE